MLDAGPTREAEPLNLRAAAYPHHSCPRIHRHPGRVLVLLAAVALTACDSGEQAATAPPPPAAPSTPAPPPRQEVVSGLYQSLFQPLPSALCPDGAQRAVVLGGAGFERRYQQITNELSWSAEQIAGPIVFFEVLALRRTETDPSSGLAGQEVLEVRRIDKMVPVEHLIAQGEQIASLCGTL